MTDDSNGAATAVQEPTEVSAASYPDLGPGAGPGPSGPLDMLGDVGLTVTVELGKVNMRMRDLLALREGSVVELDQVAGGPVDVLVNGKLVARGEVVVVGEELGVRVTDIVSRG